MTQKDTAQEHVQGFRSVQKSEPHSTTSVPLDSPNITHIDCYTDPDTNKDFILWEDIQQAFDEALFVRNKTRMLPFVRGKDYRVLEPRRIAAASDVVLDVVVADKPIAATDTATADTIASLQRAVQELSLNIPRQTPIESSTHSPPCGDEPEATQVNGRTNSPENNTPLRGPQALEYHSQDNNYGNTIDTQRSEATSNATKRLDDPQDETAAKDMDLMQTMIHANQGDVHAQVALGDRYKDGREVHQDHHAALDWYLKAAEQHHPRAQYNIGLLYEEKHDEEKHDEERDYREEDYREEYCREEDEGEEDEGEEDDGEGDDVALQDGTNAFEWFLKSALQGYADAQAKVSQAYTNGAGIPKDNIKAMEWSVKAAENGHAGTQYNMGAAYEKGQGVPQSDSRSFEWYLKSADQGFAKAQERVADALEAGRGVSRDGLMAVELYTKAADQGLPVAQFALGRVHKLGLCGLPKDRSKAVDWFIKAAVQGHTEAQSMLCEIYNYGTSYRRPDCTIDLETQSKIKEWFMDAADQGVAHAQVCMADMYTKGLGVLKDEYEAFEWLLKAAEQGDEASQRRVAYRYETGLGVTESREKSLEWYLRLAKEGNDWALHILKYMLRN
ncbi:hypothetical protein EC957_002888 [Mortierella hygrophila]|uniref:HCP-like protein n=1 Tax=Mortierella hygrophila TaxID=979708 RepID=A0A9P6F4A1_9FUNG|nr:hypothetical protein EC957_002888 [Mortierella hygrophila]